MRNAPAWLVFGMMCAAPGCGRSSPPEITKFRAPAKVGLVESYPAELAADTGTPGPEPVRVKVEMEAPKPPPRVASRPVEAKPADAPKPVEAKAPTIVGTWKAIEMVQNGQAMPGGMTMIWKFEEGGTFTMSVSGENMPQEHSESGTYTVDGAQITITMKNDPKTGSFSLEGNRLIIEIDKAKVTMERM